MYKREDIENSKKLFDDTYTLIEVDGEYELTCGACPTIYEFKDKKGNEYYFRYRSGYMSLNKDRERLYSDKVGDDYDGLCNWNDFCINAFKHHFVILDVYTDKLSWIDSGKMDEILKEYEEKSE